jgi:hypothetical protein
MTVRLIRNRRRLGFALFAAAIGLAVSGPHAAAVVPSEPEPVVTDTALFAEPSNTATTLTRGGSSVTVSKTAALTRESLTVSWSGMTPSQSAQGGAINYPVVVMQCRGYNPSREDCWNGRFYDNGDPGGGPSGIFRPDIYLPAETSSWTASRFDTAIFGRFFQLPFRQPDGSYRALRLPEGYWSVAGLGDDYKLGSVRIPPAEDFAPSTMNYRRGTTLPAGTGEVATWANTSFENPSLGCSDTSPCSLVVVPVKDRPCRTVPHISQVRNDYCNGNGKIQAGNSSYWQLLGNWYERYVFRTSFTPRATSCAQRDDMATLYGSELVSEAMRRWVPVRCQSSSPVALDYTRGWEPDGRRLVGSTDPIAPSGFASDGAVVTEPAGPDESVTRGRRPAYAPVAVSGFAIGYRWEKTDGIGGTPVAQLKLNARLVAKLLTQSYPGGYRVGLGLPVNPNAPTNPQNLLWDPEFLQLNPGAADWAGRGYSRSPIAMSIPVFKTDVVLALTRWLWSDPSARAFLQGKPDPWGTTVNKAYRGWQLPRDDYELRDGWLLPPGEGLMSGYSPQQLSAQTTNSWADAADILMTAWPRSQGVGLPQTPNPDFPTVLLRDQVQPAGLRHMIGLSTTSELAKAGMQTALLQNTAGEFVGPTVESMTYALDGATVDQSSGVWRINHPAMDKRGYPGTMISYAMVPTATLKGAAPKRYADTLRWLSTDAQSYGPEAGQLPDGYLALTDPMKEQAARVADAVEQQTGTPPIPPMNHDPLPGPKDPTPNDPAANQPGQTTPGSSGTGTGTGTGTGAAGTNSRPGSAPTTPGTSPSAGNTKPPLQAAGTKPASAATQGESLGWLTWGIPALLLAGLTAGVASPGIQLVAQPGHPVRRGVVAGGSYIAGLLRRGRRRSG